MIRFCTRWGSTLLFLLVTIGLLSSAVQAQSAGRWYYEAPQGTSPKPRNDASLVWVDDYAYLLGGTGPTPIERYDPKKSEWKRMNTVLDNLHHFQAQVYDGKIYIIGAFQGHFLYEVPYKRVLRYDPKADRLETLGELPTGRERGAAALASHDNKFYLIGGHRNGHEARTQDGKQSAPVAWIDRYDPKSGKWETLPDAPHARDHFQAVEHDGFIYAVGGGRARRGESAGLFGDVERAVDVFDPGNGRWLTGDDARALPDLPQGVTGAVAAVIDDQLVVAGGVPAGQDTPTQLTQLLDLDNRRWSVDQPMIRARHLAAGAVHKDRLYVVAGSDRSGDRLTGGNVYVEFYSQQDEKIPSFDGWVELTPSNYPRAEGHMIAYGGEFYHFNGFDFNLQLQAQNEKYNPAADTWSPLAPHPRGANGDQAATHVGIALVDDVVWIVGGRIGSHPGRVTREVYLYDISTDSWSQGPSLPAPRGAGGLARLGRKLHYIGGFDERGECNVDNHYVYDLDAPGKGWQDITATSAMPEARNHFGTVVLDGRFYAIGGQFDHDGCQKGKNLKFVHVYDPIKDSWKRLADLPDVQSHTEPSTFAYNGKLYSLGGQGARSDEVWEYDPNKDKWEVRDDLELPLRLIAPGARVYEDNLYVMVGGEVAVNVPRTQVRVTYFGENKLQELSFYPDRLDPPADRTTTQRILLSNLSAEDVVAYTVATGDLPDWLSINRSSGTARESFAEVAVTVDPRGLPNGNYSYTLKAKAAGYRDASLQIAFKVTEGGEAPEEPEVPDEPEEPTDPEPPTDTPVAGTSVEAECTTAEEATAWVVVQHQDASDGVCLTPAAGAAIKGSTPSNTVTGSARIGTEVPKAGSYYLNVRTIAPDGLSDSFWYRVNGGSWVQWGVGLQTGNEFAWRQYRQGRIELPAGQVVLELYPREEGVLLDKFFLSAAAELPTTTDAGTEACLDLAPEEVPIPDDDGDTPNEYLLYAEAECAVRTADWQTVRDARTRNLVSVCVGESSYDAPAGGATDDQLTFSVEVPETDEYTLYFRLSAPTNSANSFWVRLDGGDWIKYWTELDGSALLTTDFEWRQVNDTGRALRFTLSKGNHRITVANRESGTLLDKLLLTNAARLPDNPSTSDLECGTVAGQQVALTAPGSQAAAQTSAAEGPVMGGMVVYPNPTSSVLSVALDGVGEGDVLLRVYDLNGRSVLQQPVVARMGGRLRQQLTVDGLPAGMYRVSAHQDGKQWATTFVRQ